MADNKKYYYLKLKDNFFDSDAMIVLESMPDGYLYSNILLKLYLRSLKNNGVLMFSERIPYNTTVLAKVTRHSVGVVEKALSILKELELIEVLDNGVIFMTDIQNLIGASSSEADRIRKWRKSIDKAKTLQMYDKCTPEIEIEKEIEKEIEIEKKKPTKNIPPTLEEVQAYTNTRSTQIDAERFIDYYQARNWMLGKVKMKDWKAAVRTWEKNEQERVQHNKPMSSNPFKDILKELENEQEGNRNVDGDYQDSISGVLPEPDGFDRRG